MKRYWVLAAILLCGACVFTSCTLSNEDSGTPSEEEAYTGIPLVIFDTDLCSSTDDLFAMELLYNYEAQGQCELLGIVIDREGEQNAAFADVMNTYFGRADVPIGFVRNGIDNPRVFIDYAPLHALKDSEGNLMFSHSISDYTALPDGWKLYRQLLVSQPDHSVSICSTGFVTCLAQLLESEADDYSPLNGVELVRQKVKCLYLMGGNFHTPPVAEYNIEAGFKFAKVFFSLWPRDVDILFSPSEVGGNLYYSGEMIIDDISWTDIHPIKQIYLQLPHDTYQRMWDPLAVIQAVEGDEHFTLSERGSVTLTTKAETVFTPSATGNCRYQLRGTASWNTQMLEKIRTVTKQLRGV